MNKMLEELIVKEYINIVKELKDMNESNMEGIINLAKDNMMSKVYDIIDRVDVKEVQYSIVQLESIVYIICIVYSPAVYIET